MRWGIRLGMLAVAMELFALVALNTSPESNSALWFPLNAGYFGGILVAFVAVVFALVGLASSARTVRAAIPLVLALAAVLIARLAPYR